MKQQTSDLIDSRTQVAKIAALLGLAKYTTRHMIPDGTYVYFFKNPGNDDRHFNGAKQLLEAKLQADENFPYVSIQMPVTDTITLQLDPRDNHTRKIKPAKPVEVKKISLDEFFQDMKEERVRIQRVKHYFRVVAIERGLPTGYLVAAEDLALVVHNYKVNHDTSSHYIRSISEISPFDFVVFSLTGNYEVVNLFDPQD